MPSVPRPKNFVDAPKPALATPKSAFTAPGLVVAPQKAQWLRPGVLVHDPAESVDVLTVDFAANLRERGFSTLGLARAAQKTADGAPLSVDLSSGGLMLETPGAASKILRQAIDQKADFIALTRFPACTEAADACALPIGAGAGAGLPLLTAIAGAAIHHWHRFVRQDGSMIAPDARALWRWWGPDRLYDDLALGVAEDEVVRIVCGPRWILVQGRHGAGLAYLPRHPREFLPRLEALSRLSLRALAGFCQSWNPLEAALGVAAVNAFYNRYDLDAFSGNGVKNFRNAPGPVVVIGAFPGVDAILPDCAIIETDPRPGEYPTAAMEALLPGCGGAIVNSSALVNRSLLRILRLARGRAVALIGPSTPLTPRLHDYGLASLGGFVVRDVSGLAAAIAAGAAPREFSRFGRYVHLRDDGAV